MEDLLTQILDRYAKVTETRSERNPDQQRSAYIKGQADGLRLAKDLYSMLVEYGHMAEPKTAPGEPVLASR
jgi:hypothetical protein